MTNQDIDDSDAISNPKMQQLFNNCMKFLITDGTYYRLLRNDIWCKILYNFIRDFVFQLTLKILGIENLLNLIDQLTREATESIKLTEPMDKKSFRLFVEKIGSKLELFIGDKNFSDFVIPSSQVYYIVNEYFYL